MHLIEPYYPWLEVYDSEKDDRSPFFDVVHSEFEFTDTVYSYCIHPQWENIGSETLYLKILYADYSSGALIIEFIGEWNDALHNDVMYLKRNLIDYYLLQGFRQFVLIGENVFNFHGSEDEYYDEWLEEIEDGWIVSIGFQDHVIDEMSKFGIDACFNYGGDLTFDDWRSFHPLKLISKINHIMTRRLGLI